MNVNVLEETFKEARKGILVGHAYFSFRFPEGRRINKKSRLKSPECFIMSGRKECKTHLSLIANTLDHNCLQGSCSIRVSKPPSREDNQQKSSGKRAGRK